MNARFSWGREGESELATAPVRHGDSRHEVTWGDAWDWREAGDATLYRGGVRPWRAGRSTGMLSAWEVGAIRAIVCSCGSATIEWQELADVCVQDDAMRDCCVRNARQLHEAATELTNLAPELLEDGADPRPRPRRSAAWRESRPRRWVELLGRIALHQSSLCERFETAAAGTRDECLREAVVRLGEGAKLGLEDVRQMLEATNPGNQNKANDTRAA